MKIWSKTVPCTYTYYTWNDISPQEIYVKYNPFTELGNLPCFWMACQPSHTCPKFLPSRPNFQTNDKECSLYHSTNSPIQSISGALTQTPQLGLLNSLDMTVLTIRLLTRSFATVNIWNIDFICSYFLCRCQFHASLRVIHQKNSKSFVFHHVERF